MNDQPMDVGHRVGTVCGSRGWDGWRRAKVGGNWDNCYRMIVKYLCKKRKVKLNYPKIESVAFLSLREDIQIVPR